MGGADIRSDHLKAVFRPSSHDKPTAPQELFFPDVTALLSIASTANYAGDRNTPQADAASCRKKVLKRPRLRFAFERYFSHSPGCQDSRNGGGWSPPEHRFFPSDAQN